jgi:hypothetical protein
MTAAAQHIVNQSVMLSGYVFLLLLLVVLSVI